MSTAEAAAAASATSAAEPQPQAARRTLTVIPELQGGYPQLQASSRTNDLRNRPDDGARRRSHDICAARRGPAAEAGCGTVRSAAGVSPTADEAPRAQSPLVRLIGNNSSRAGTRDQVFPPAAAPGLEQRQVEYTSRWGPPPPQPPQPQPPGLLASLLRQALVTHLSMSNSARTLQQQLLLQLQPRQASPDVQATVFSRRRPPPPSPLPWPSPRHSLEERDESLGRQLLQPPQPRQQPLRGMAVGVAAAVDVGQCSGSLARSFCATNSPWSGTAATSQTSASPRTSLDASSGGPPPEQRLLSLGVQLNTAAAAAAAPPPFTPLQLPTVDGLLYMWPGVERAMKRRSWRMDDFELARLMHQGYASKVYKAVCLRSRREVVLKIYSLDDLSEFLTHQMLRELHIHSQLEHPGIAQLYGAFKEGQRLVLVLQYARGGTLNRARQRLGARLSEAQALQLVLLPLLRVLGYLHARRILHRDIKPENLLFTPDWTLKLCDFGVSLCTAIERPVTRTGSGDYMAPEVRHCPLKEQPGDNKTNPALAYTTAVDIWSVGVLSYSLLVGFMPFPGGLPAARPQAAAAAAATTATAAAAAEPSLAFPSSVSPEARGFVESCLRLRPEDRPTIGELLQHPWVRGAARSGRGSFEARPAAAGGDQAAGPF
ncbi:hypothetical protein PLESTF_000285800 [Pleodorina starrii]|nr:hypothetical protein PLESTM_001200100 [Pleodorina starrii]GLC65369.1 hypothetical protein PLESTF_000285800 [Pleodorina starrii]